MVICDQCGEMEYPYMECKCLINKKKQGGSCEHKFVPFDTIKSTENGIWERIDKFYCEKCLEYENKVQREWSINKPDWY